MLRDEQRAATRRRVLKAAAKLFVERGYEKTTTRAIAHRAGVAVGTVFTHFPDKATLAEALLFDHVERALSTASKALPARGLVKRLVSVSLALFRAYEAEPELSKVLLQQGLFATSVEGPLAEQLARFQAWVATEVDEAAAHGERLVVSQAHFFTGFFAVYFALLVGGLQGRLDGKAQKAALAALLQTMVAKQSTARRRKAR
jgi:AcrR family transcriptional regulator